MKYNKTIYINKKTEKIINGLLVEPKTEDNWSGSGVLYGLSIIFDNGFQMDINIVGVLQFEQGTTNKPWTECILFDNNGFELCCSEVEEDFIKEWSINYDENQYTVNIVISNE